MASQSHEKHANQHFVIRNPHEVFLEQQDVGQRTADWVAKMVGSWRFIIVQSFVIMLWVIANGVAWVSHWDPYPFILMNLMLSMQAAMTAPIIMMSQNRQGEKDRIESHIDYMVNTKAEEEIRGLMVAISENREMLTQIMQSIQDIKAKS